MLTPLIVWTKDPVLTEEDEMHLLAAMPGWLYIDTRGDTQASVLQVCNAYLSIYLHRSMSVIMCLSKGGPGDEDIRPHWALDTGSWPQILQHIRYGFYPV